MAGKVRCRKYNTKAFGGDWHYLLVKDTLLRSPSSAAILVNGRSTNGWDAWVAEDGRTLSYVYREGGS